MVATTAGTLELQLIADITRLQRDMRDAQRTIDTMTNAGAQSAGRLGSAFKSANDNIAGAGRGAQQLASDIQRLKGQLDPAWQSQQRFNQQQELGMRAFKAGAIDRQQFIQHMRQINAELKGVQQPMGQVTQSAGAQRAGMQQLGFQLQDFAVQVAGGTSATRAFAQQFPQAIGAVQLMTGSTGKLGAFLGGPWGIALGVAAAALVPLIGKLFETKDALDKVGAAADDAMAKLRQSLAQASAVSGAATEGVQKLITAQAALAKANKEIADIEASPNKSQGFRLIEAQKEREKQLKAVAKAQNDLREVQETASVTIAMQTRNQERLNATTEKGSKATRGLSDEEKARLKGINDAQRSYDQRFDASQSYIESLQRQVDEFGKTEKEIRLMEVARRMEAAATDEQRAAIKRLSDQIEMQIGTKQLADEMKREADWRKDVISALEKEVQLHGLVGAAREVAALAMEKDAFVADLLEKGLTDVNAKWEEYYQLRMSLIQGKSALEREEEAASRLLDQMDALISGFGRMSGMGALGDFGRILTAKNPVAEMLSMGGLGTIAGSLLGGSDLTKKMGDEFTQSILQTFPNLNKELAGDIGGTLANVFQGAGIGASVGSIMGGGKSAQLGSMIGGALGQEFGGKLIGAVSSKLLSSLGGAAGPIGAIAGSLLGGVLGGMLKSNRSASAYLTGGDSMLVGGKDKGQHGAATDLGRSVIGALEQIADAFGVAVGSFQTSIGVRGDQIRVNADRNSLKFDQGAIGFGQDAEAALKFAIRDAISDGVFDGLSAGVERLLKGEGDIEAQLQKALSFQSVFDELRQLKDPKGAEMDALDVWRKSMDAIFTEAGATADELAKLEELTGLKRKEIVEKYANAIGDAEELAREKRALEIQIMELSGDTVGALAAAREIEKAEADASLHPLYDRIYALQDEAVAAQVAAEAEAQAQALAQARREMEIRIMELSGDAAGALAAQRQLELAALDPSLRALQERIYALQDEAAAQAAAAEAAAQAHALAEERRGLEIRLLEQQGLAEDALRLRREQEMAAIDPLNRALLQLIYNAEDAAAATQKAAQAQANAVSNIQSVMSFSPGSGAMGFLSNPVLAGLKPGVGVKEQLDSYFSDQLRTGFPGNAGAMDLAPGLADAFMRQLTKSSLSPDWARGPSTAGNAAIGIDWERHYEAANRSRMEALDAQAKALQASREEHERQADAIHKTIDEFQALSDSLRDFRDGLLGAESSVAGYRNLQVRFMEIAALARGGDKAAMQDLPGIGRDFLDVSRNRASTVQQYQRDLAFVLAGTNEAIDAAEGAIDYQDAQLAALDRQYDEMRGLREEVRGLREDIRRADGNRQSEAIAIAKNTRVSADEAKRSRRLASDPGAELVLDGLVS